MSYDAMLIFWYFFRSSSHEIESLQDMEAAIDIEIGINEDYFSKPEVNTFIFFMYYMEIYRADQSINAIQIKLYLCHYAL